MAMEGSVGLTAPVEQEFALASISELSSSSSSSSSAAASSSPAVARFYADSAVAELRFRQPPESIASVNVDLQNAQVRFAFWCLVILFV